MAGDFSRGFGQGLGLVRSKQELEAQEEARRMREELEREILKLRKKEGRRADEDRDATREITQAQLDEQIRTNKEREFQDRQGLRLAMLDQVQRQQNTFRDQLARNEGEVNVSYKGQGGEVVSMKGSPQTIQQNLASLQGRMAPANPFAEAMAEVEVSDPSGQGKAKLRVPVSELGRFGFPTGEANSAAGAFDAANPIQARMQEIDTAILDHEVQLIQGSKKTGWFSGDRQKKIKELKNEKAQLIRLRMQRGEISEEQARAELQKLL